MINSSTFLLIFVIFANLSLIQNVKCETALIFNFEQQQLVKPRELKENETVTWYEVTSCVLACPTDSVDIEKNLINEERSITGNSVFAKYVYENEVLLKDIDFCSKSFKPTTVFDQSTKSIEIGYELFYVDRTISTLKYEKYNQLSRVYKKYTNEEEVQIDSFQVKKIDHDGNTKFQAPGSKLKWAYFWVSVLSIKSARARRQITFKKDSINDSFQLTDYFSKTCKDYTLGDESQSASSRNKIEHLLKIANQRRNSNNENSLQIMQIIPMRYFHTLSAKLATCTEFNLAFVWKSIEMGYEKVDSYLYKIYKTWPSEVNIIFGVQGSRDENSNESPDTSILENFTMPTPDILYRIVEYHETDITLNVVIVIHNNDSAVQDENRICLAKDEVQGWNMMKIQNPIQGPYNLGLAYACPVTDDIITKLQVRYTITEKMSPFILDENRQRSIIPNTSTTTY